MSIVVSSGVALSATPDAPGVPALEPPDLRGISAAGGGAAAGFAEQLLPRGPRRAAQAAKIACLNRLLTMKLLSFPASPPFRGLCAIVTADVRSDTR
jgi:hypothetical protein